MRRAFLSACGLFLALATLAAAPLAAASHHYVCPPCGQDCDSRVFEKPGVCPKCGMQLVAAESVRPPSVRVAVLVFNNVEIIDYTGPWEMFGAAGFEVFTVAASRTPVTTAMGMKLVPQYTFADAPLPDVLLVPGGGIRTATGDPAALAWVKRASAASKITLSVCNGAFILAKAGLLDGLTATTTFSHLDELHETYPKVTISRDQRFVDNGKVITAAGLSAGIDGALHVISRLSGEGMAQEVALSEEYEWKPSGGFVRSSLAEARFPNLHLPQVGPWKVVSSTGDADRWDTVVSGGRGLSQEQLADSIDAQMRQGHWAPQPAAGADAREWTHTDWAGRAWKVQLTLAPEKDAGYTATLAMRRAD